MQKFFEDHAKGFHNVSSSMMWKEYTSDYYKMDTYYRMFHVAFKSSLTLTNSYLDDLFKQVADQKIYDGQQRFRNLHAGRRKSKTVRKRSLVFATD